MMRLKASKDLSRGFQVSSEISFLISVRKVLPTSGQTVDLTTKNFWFGTKRPHSPSKPEKITILGLQTLTTREFTM